MHKVMMLVALIALSVAGVSAQTSAPSEAWDALTAVIEASDLTEIVVIVGDENGQQYSHIKGEIADFDGANITVDIASASKWLTAATIMVLVEQGVMSLDDRPQDYLDWWTSDPADPRSQVTLAQLLSFTSGFQGEPLCILNGSANPQDCARTVYDNYHSFAPGSTFFYSSTHMHIAGVMAVEAAGRSFAQLFRDVVADPIGMSERTQFSRNGTNNPWLAGGAVSNANDYALFLQALLSGELLANSRDVMFQDWTPAPVQIVYSPVGPYWHYALGAWRECFELTWTQSCADTVLVSSGGALGWFPWIDSENGYYGLVARRGAPMSGAVGPSIELAYELRPHILTALAGQQ